MSRCTVRPARPAEAVAIAQLRIETWRAAYAGIIDASVLEGLAVDSADVRRRAARIRKPQAGVHTLVAIGGDNDVVGFAVGGPSRDDDVDDATGELYALYVAAAHWGTGVGRELMAAAAAALQAGGFRRVSLWVLEGNARARRFYSAAGLAPDGARKLLEIAAGVPEIRYVGLL